MISSHFSEVIISDSHEIVHLQARETVSIFLWKKNFTDTWNSIFIPAQCFLKKISLYSVSTIQSSSKACVVHLDSLEIALQSASRPEQALKLILRS